MVVHFEWDANKNQENIRKHGIDFTDVEGLFDHPTLTWLDERDHYGEARWVSVGLLQAFVGVVVYTERVDDVIRIISARRAIKYEVRRYEQAVKNGLETPG